MLSGGKFEQVEMPILPGSINSIMAMNPEMTSADATKLLSEQLGRYQAAASAMLGVTQSELHEMKSEEIRYKLEVGNVGETERV